MQYSLKTVQRPSISSASKFRSETCIYGFSNSKEDPFLSDFVHKVCKLKLVNYQPPRVHHSYLLKAHCTNVRTNNFQQNDIEHHQFQRIITHGGLTSTPRECNLLCSSSNARIPEVSTFIRSIKEKCRGSLHKIIAKFYEFRY